MVLINGKYIAGYKSIVKLTIVSRNKCAIKYLLLLQNTFNINMKKVAIVVIYFLYEFKIYMNFLYELK